MAEIGAVVDLVEARVGFKVEILLITEEMVGFFGGVLILIGGKIGWGCGCGCGAGVDAVTLILTNLGSSGSSGFDSLGLVRT